MDLLLRKTLGYITYSLVFHRLELIVHVQMNIVCMRSLPQVAIKLSEHRCTRDGILLIYPGSVTYRQKSNDSVKLAMPAKRIGDVSTHQVKEDKRMK
jgi:hypothetical protein